MMECLFNFISLMMLIGIPVAVLFVWIKYLEKEIMADERKRKIKEVLRRIKKG